MAFIDLLDFGCLVQPGSRVCVQAVPSKTAEAGDAGIGVEACWLVFLDEGAANQHQY